MEDTANSKDKEQNTMPEGSNLCSIFFSSLKGCNRGAVVRSLTSCNRVFEFIHSATKKKLYILISCESWFCPQCGGKDGRYHNTQQQRVLKRLPLHHIVLQQLIFTIPEELRHHFIRQKELNALFNIVRRCISKHFGTVKHHREGRDPEYQLNNGVVAYLHLCGTSTFHPHINVHIVLKRSEVNSEKDLRIPPTLLNSIKTTYRHALKSYVIAKLKFSPTTNPDLFSKIARANIHFDYKFRLSAVENAIRYMTSPPDITLLRLYVPIWSYKKFRLVRYWGMLSNKKWRQYYRYLTGTDPPAASVSTSGYERVRVLSLLEFKVLRDSIDKDSSYVDANINVALEGPELPPKKLVIK